MRPILNVYLPTTQNRENREMGDGTLRSIAVFRFTPTCELREYRPAVSR